VKPNQLDSRRLKVRRMPREQQDSTRAERARQETQVRREQRRQKQADRG
jgi:hypothetical protein